MHFFPFLRRIKFCSGYFRQSFFIWDTKKVVAGHVRQVVVLYSNKYKEFDLGGLSIGHVRRVVVLQRWSIEQVRL